MPKHTAIHIQHMTRFFWIPRGAERHAPTPYRRLTGIWLSALALGAALTAIGWDDELGGSYIMAAILLLNVIDDIIQGVRHRWPAAVAALAALYGTSRLANAALPDSLDSAWAQTITAATGVTLGFAVAAAVTRLPARTAAAR